jgi:NAD-dependent SIR2 family protein deacetylase
MRDYPRNRFVSNDYKEECSRCGWDFLHSELVKEERTNLWVCRACYDPIHPQDEIKKRSARRFVKEA